MLLGNQLSEVFKNWAHLERLAQLNKLGPNCCGFCGLFLGHQNIKQSEINWWTRWDHLPKQGLDAGIGKQTTLQRSGRQGRVALKNDPELAKRFFCLSLGQIEIC